MTIEFHPLANLFPLIEGDEFTEFCEDIRKNGVRDPIELFEGKILDGRNRYRALAQLLDTAAIRGEGWGVFAGSCMLADDLEPAGDVLWFKQFDPAIDGDPLTYVLSKNLRRRHLNESQRATVAAKLANLPNPRTLAHHPAEERRNSSENSSANLQNPPPAPVSQADAAGLLNVSTRSVATAKKVLERGTPALVRAVDQGHMSVSAAAMTLDLPRAAQNKIAAKAEAGEANAARTITKQLRRAEREVELARKITALPQKRFGVIVADPEWDYEVWSRETGMDRAAANHYPTSPTYVIAQRDVASIAADHCACFLWVPVPHLPDGLAVLAAWGFRYVSHWIWQKVGVGNRLGMGFWGRVDHELLLIGTKGNVPAPAQGTQWPHTVIPAPLGEHSEKPELFLRIIENYFPNVPKIELNRRGPARPGWDAWGNEFLNETEPGQSPAEPGVTPGREGSGVGAPGGADAPGTGGGNAAPSPIPSMEDDDGEARDGETAEPAGGACHDGDTGDGNRPGERGGEVDARSGAEEADAGGPHQGHAAAPDADADRSRSGQPATAPGDLHDEIIPSGGVGIDAPPPANVAGGGDAGLHWNVPPADVSRHEVEPAPVMDNGADATGNAGAPADIAPDQTSVDPQPKAAGGDDEEVTQTGAAEPDSSKPTAAPDEDLTIPDFLRRSK